MSKRSTSSSPGAQQQQQQKKSAKKSAKKKSADSYVQKAKTILKVREDQVKQYTNMLSTGKPMKKSKKAIKKIVNKLKPTR